MDKSTLSNYGWIVIAVLVLAVMVALASPFGHFIEAGVKSTAQGLFDVNQSAGAIIGLDMPEQDFCKHTETEIRNTDTNYTGDTCCKLCNKVLIKGTYIVPTGGTYYVGVTSTSTGDYTGATATFTEGQAIPDKVNTGDVYVFGDYEYRYNQYYGTFGWTSDTTQSCWGVRVLDTGKTTYGAILESINGKPVTSLSSTFKGCTSLTTPPSIPSSVTNMQSTFSNCTSLVTAPDMSNANSVTNMSYTFSNCTSLTIAPVIPSSVTNMYYTFLDCKNLTTAPVIPSSVTNMYGTFSECTKLTTAPTIPNSVTTMSGTFYECTALTTAPVIPSSVTNMEGTFMGCTKLTTAPSIPNSVTYMHSTFKNCTSLVTAPDMSNANSVTNMSSTFWGCTSLVTVPEIPSSVTNMYGTFKGCTALTGTIEINTNNITTNTGYDNTCAKCFYGVDMTSITLTGSASKDVLNLIGSTGNNWTPIS